MQAKELRLPNLPLGCRHQHDETAYHEEDVDTAFAKRSEINQSIYAGNLAQAVMPNEHERSDREQILSSRNRPALPDRQSSAAFLGFPCR